MTDPIRICVIGNSHMAALRAGWAEAAPRHPGLSLTFRGRGQNGMSYVRPEGSRLVCIDEGGSIWMQRATGVAEIETAGYDGFLLVGMWSGLRWLESALRFTALASLPSAAAMLVSDEAAAAAVRDAYRDTSEHYVARLLRDIHGAAPPIFCLPAPRLAAEALDTPLEPLWAQPQICRAAIADGSAAEWQATEERLMGPELHHALGLIRLDHPPGTIESHILSRSGLRRGAMRLEGSQPQPDNDFNHMNAEFGALTLDAIAPRLIAGG